MSDVIWRHKGEFPLSDAEVLSILAHKKDKVRAIMQAPLDGRVSAVCKEAIVDGTLLLCDTTVATLVISQDGMPHKPKRVEVWLNDCTQIEKITNETKS